jgi:RND family efflux transporter MFP subunit
MNKSSRTLGAALLAIAVLALAACGDHDHGPGGHAHDDHGADTPSESVTHYTAATELFVEFPRLVQGDAAEFVAHLTTLADFRPVADGRLLVELSGGGQPEERAEAGTSATPGIFKPTITPRHAGKRRVVLRLASPQAAAVHDLGEFDVYANARAAAAAPAPVEPPGGIRFTKEDQWRIDFALATVKEQALRRSVAVTGVVRAPADAEAFVVAPAAGALSAQQRPPQVGERVRRGEVLANLVPRLAGDVDAATLALAVRRARLELDHAVRERERMEALVQAEAVAERRLIDARAREALVRAELASAEQRLAPYQGGAGGIALRAPIDGTLVAVNAAPGGGVSEGQVLFQIARLERVWIEARVPEAEAPRVARPAGADVEVDGLDAPLVLDFGRNARLVGAGGVVDPVSRTVPIRFEVTNPDGRLHIGTAVRVRLHAGDAVRALAVPAAAIVDDQGVSTVFVQRGGETFERRAVETTLRDGDRIGIARGLAEGERVVARGAADVRRAAAAPAAAGHGHNH